MEESVETRITNASSPLLPPYPDPFDIPVILDDVKRFDDFRMSRFSYFSLEATTAFDDWVTILRERKIPFLLLGLTPVIYRPNLEQARFNSPQQVDELFNAIEEVEGLIVETAHVWLPNFLFENSTTWGRWKLARSRESTQSMRGAVWRISFELFQRALQYGLELLPKSQFSKACEELVINGQKPVIFSPGETTVLQEWSVAQFDAARRNYLEQREDPDRGVLDWLDESGNLQRG